MKRWLLTISVVLCALLCLAFGSWWVWREWYATEQLLYAFVNGDESQAKFLIRLGASIDADIDGGPFQGKPLHWATVEGHSDAAKLLLERGAKVDARDLIGQTPLHWATAEGHSNVAKLLLEHGAKVDAKDKRCCSF